MSTLTVDFEKVQRAVEDLKKNPPGKDEIMKDPKAFLAKHGVTIDDAMHNMIKTRLGGAQNTASMQAGIVHIDVG
jgi:hypothetical protein